MSFWKSLTESTAETISRLHKEATQHKKSGNMDQAIASLKKAAGLMKLSADPYPTESWTRLGLFLQQAGRYDEAMEYFEDLLSAPPLTSLKDEARVMSGQTPPSSPAFRSQSFRVTILDKMRLAAEREGRTNLAAALRAQHAEETITLETLRAAVEREREEITRQWKKRQEALRRRSEARSGRTKGQ